MFTHYDTIFWDDGLLTYGACTNPSFCEWMVPGTGQED